MSTGQTNFGDGGIGANFGCFGVNTDWTNWLSGSYSSGMVGRIINGSYNWDASQAASCNFNGGTTTGHHDLWDTASPYNRRVYTSDLNTGRSAGAWHTLGCTDYWQTIVSFYIGLWRQASQSHSWHYAGSGSTSGKSADDGNISSGANLGYGKPGGYFTVQNTEVYLLRGGSWKRTLVYVRRSGGWPATITWIRRSGGWTIVSQLPEFIPLQGTLPDGFEFGDRPRRGVYCPAGILGCPFCEEAWLVPGEFGWFGGLDASLLGFDWWKEGHRPHNPEAWVRAFESPRRNSAQTQEEVDRLWQALEVKRRFHAEGVTAAALEWNWARSEEGQTIDGWDSMRFSRRATRSFTSLMREAEPRLSSAVIAPRTSVKILA